MSGANNDYRDIISTNLLEHFRALGIVVLDKNIFLSFSLLLAEQPEFCMKCIYRTLLTELHARNIPAESINFDLMV